MLLKVVKIGGSLFDWPQAKSRLRRWLNAEGESNHVFVAGGGQFVDLIRRWDARFKLGNEVAHDRALDVLSLSSRLVRQWVPHAHWTDRFEELLPKKFPIVFDCSTWTRQLDIPKTWDITSDSLTAILSDQLNATELVLLKSRLPHPDCETGGDLVDPLFHRYSKTPVRIVNLRSASFESVILQQRICRSRVCPRHGNIATLSRCQSGTD